MGLGNWFPISSSCLLFSYKSSRVDLKWTEFFGFFSALVLPPECVVLVDKVVVTEKIKGYLTILIVFLSSV